MSHLARALEHLDVIEAHLIAAEDAPEAPPELLARIRNRLRVIEMFIAYHAAQYEAGREGRHQ